MKIEKDIIGHALTDYYFHKEENVILIHSPDFEEDEIPVSWYFRSFDQMPGIEKTAMSLCKGEILDLAITDDALATAPRSARARLRPRIFLREPVKS